MTQEIQERKNKNRFGLFWQTKVKIDVKKLSRNSKTVIELKKTLYIWKKTKKNHLKIFEKRTKKKKMQILVQNKKNGQN